MLMTIEGGRISLLQGEYPLTYLSSNKRSALKTYNTSNNKQTQYNICHGFKKGEWHERGYKEWYDYMLIKKIKISETEKNLLYKMKISIE